MRNRDAANTCNKEVHDEFTVGLSSRQDEEAYIDSPFSRRRLEDEQEEEPDVDAAHQISERRPKQELRCAFREVEDVRPRRRGSDESRDGAEEQASLGRVSAHQSSRALQVVQ